MPATNALKQYKGQSFYHLYNRGNDKQEIFLCEQDYHKFISITLELKKIMMNTVKFHAFSILPNHFHFLVFQWNERSIEMFMKRLAIRYIWYYKKRYGLFGHLFQGRYRGVLIKNNQHYLDVKNYILNNPKEAGLDTWPYVGTSL